MDYRSITMEQLDKEHICCSMTEKKGEYGITNKKTWLKERMKEGLVFYKGDVRGKVFIEYLPADAVWAPIEAKNWMHINCLWVSGSFKGKGYSQELLQYCIQDAQAHGMQGITILSGKKKLPFLSDPAYLTCQGFQTADEAGMYHLRYLPLAASITKPIFCSHVFHPTHPPHTFVLYYSDQCPFAITYAQRFADWMQAWKQPFKLHHITTQKQARDCPSPVTSYALFYGNSFITSEILSEKKAKELLKRYGNEDLSAG